MSWEFFRAHPMRTLPAPADAGVDASGPSDLGAPQDVGADLARADLAIPDLLTPDLAIPDLATQDSSVSQDLTQPQDFSTPPVQTRLVAIAAESGFVGQVAADGMGVATVKAGDKGLFNSDSFRAILSFDTAGLPTTAPRSAALVLTRKGMTGSVISLSVDVKRGAFGRDASLAAEDYAAAATSSAVTSFTPPLRDGDQVTVPIPSTALFPFTSPRVQVRLAAKTGVDFRADTVEFWATGASAAQLVLTY